VGIVALIILIIVNLKAAKQISLTKTIPIVMVTPADPVATGLIDSLARPGGNITGLTRLTRDLSGKRLELFKEVVPKISRIGILNAGTNIRADFEAYEAAARHLQLELQSLEVHGPNPEFEKAFQAAVKGRVNALVTVSTALLLDNPKRIADLAIKNRLPSMHEGNQYVEAGGLMSYAANDADQYRPADLPVEQPTKFEFVINLKTAKQIDVTIPPDVLARTTKIIR
jgi:putative ABC transport system substrate-binding protein